MARNKVVINGQTYIDLTSTTATAATILSGFGAFGADGVWINGTASGGGGGGLVYETGTWTPSSDTTHGTINLSGSHDKPPFCYSVCPAEGSAYPSATNSAVVCTFIDLYQLTGSYVRYSASSTRCGLFYYSYRGTGSNTSTASIWVSYPYTNSGSSSTSYSRYYATETALKPYGGSTSRYFRSDTTFDWIAVWAA